MLRRYILILSPRLATGLLKLVQVKGIVTEGYQEQGIIL